MAVLKVVILVACCWLLFVCVGTSILVVKGLFSRWYHKRKEIKNNNAPNEQKGTKDDGYPY